MASSLQNLGLGTRFKFKLLCLARTGLQSPHIQPARTNATDCTNYNTGQQQTPKTQKHVQCAAPTRPFTACTRLRMATPQPPHVVHPVRLILCSGEEFTVHIGRNRANSQPPPSPATCRSLPILGRHSPPHLTRQLQTHTSSFLHVHNQAGRPPRRSSHGVRVWPPDRQCHTPKPGPSSAPCGVLLARQIRSNVCD